MQEPDGSGTYHIAQQQTGTAAEGSSMERACSAKEKKVEAEEGIEPSNDGFANHCLTTWLLRRNV